MAIIHGRENSSLDLTSQSDSNMKTSTSFFIALCWAFGLNNLAAQTDSLKLKPGYFEVNDYVDDNESCLKCHGEVKYTLTDTVYDLTSTQSMCPDRIIDRDNYYAGVHKAFACLDCHTDEFNIFPHTLESRFEENYQCLDCHGGDESFAKYHFEEIEEEFLSSTHNMEGFTCWKCHDPHSFQTVMRNSDDLKKAILYDNKMCLYCHANYNNFLQLTTLHIFV